MQDVRWSSGGHDAHHPVNIQSITNDRFRAGAAKPLGSLLITREADDLMPLRHELLYDGKSQHSGCAGDEDSHAISVKRET
jgi:hypothetical protein